jgi:hypothetical protein
MLVSKKLVFLELQKTGSTHIKQLLKQTIGGKNDGKHNQASPELRASGKEFVGSIRDPWSWYLSLFTYGCQEKGGVFIRTTNPKHWNKLTAEEKATPGYEHYDVEFAKSMYKDPEDATNFKHWLKLVTTTGPHRKLIEDGFYASPLSSVAGLMTFRYFLLFCDEGVSVPESMKTMKALKEYEEQHRFVKHIIRNESLAEDLIQVIGACGETLTDEHLAAIREAPKTNQSARKHSRSHYYDDIAVQLVAKREKFIIDKFGYKYA